MARMHLVELEDLSWWPADWRDAGTAYLRWAVQIGGQASALLPSIRRILEQSGDREILELCSGDGGPIRVLARALAAENAENGEAPVRVLLSDLYPNRTAMAEVEAESGGMIRYYANPVDATKVPAELRGTRLMFNSFHHLAPLQAAEVLADAVRHHRSIGVFEIVSRGLFPMLGMLPTPLLFAVSLPFRKPRMSWLFWTYIVPVLPLFVLWDGLVSCLRVYSPEELQALIATVPGREGYNWEISRVKLSGPMYATVLLATPRVISGAPPAGREAPAGSKSSSRRGTPRDRAFTRPARFATATAGTDWTMRSLTSSPSSTTCSLEPVPRPSRRRVAAGNTICPFDDTTRIDIRRS